MVINLEKHSIFVDVMLSKTLKTSATQILCLVSDMMIINEPLETGK
jgi:hypothetical protein